MLKLGVESETRSPACAGRPLGVLAAACLGLPVLWLWLSAVFVTVELYDGYDAICNARFFIGNGPYFIPSRAPLLALVLTPAALLHRALGLPALAVWPYHLTMAALHTAYLVGVFAFLRKRLGLTPAMLAAFASSVLSFVFFSYAPFLSRDIVPGLLLIAMLVLTEHFVERPRIGVWLGLVALGALSVLIKQTYGVFWAAILGSRCLPYLFPKRVFRRSDFKTWLALTGGAVASALAYWLIMAVVLKSTWPREPFLLLPYRQLTKVMEQYRGTGIRFPIWIYLRNMPFYGWLSLAALGPGLWYCLRGDRFRQSLALVWLTAFGMLHLSGFREVRYMAFLAPLSAFLGAHAIEKAFRHRGLLIAGLALLSLDVWSAGKEALRLRAGFYRRSPARRFCDTLLDSDGRPRKPVFMQGPLSFMPPLNSPFAGDRYHRLFHLDKHHLVFLYGIARSDLRSVRDPLHQLRTEAALYPGSVLLTATAPLVNPVRFRAGPPAGIDKFVMAATVSRRVATFDPVAAVRSGIGKDGFRLISVAGLGKQLGSVLCPCLKTPSGDALFPLEVAGPDTVRVRMDGPDPPPAPGGKPWEIWGFQVRVLVIPAASRPGLRIVTSQAPTGKSERR
ncbi:MAG: glycosyltransferase family 39 protein [Kiritimatiellaeota bacterium]|nr:glycosyltransferase family 39 protein [Kiritimatiellota bacterium]